MSLKLNKKHQVAKDLLLKTLPNAEAADIKDGIELIKKIKYAKFDETLEFNAVLGIDAKKSDQNVRGVVSMPAGTGKTIKVAVLAEASLLEDAKSSGADFYNVEEILSNIEKNIINFDILIASPGMIAQIAKYAKILGPKGLMPNPKLGTVTRDIGNAVKIAKAGQVEYRSDKGGNILAGIGKLSFSTEDLISNFNAILDAVIKARPATAKGTYVKKLYISSTNGHSIRLNIPNLI